jgi:RNA polymerase sigma-70 factor (ECF subfamily)
LETKDDSYILVKRFQNGDIPAFNLIVDQWKDKIHRFVYRFLMDSDDANEITQKTFIKAYQKLDTLDEPEKFSPWIYRVANNLCLDELKRAGRSKFDTVDDWSEHTGKTKSPQQNLEMSELSELLQKALMTLPDEQRVVVVMKQYEGFTFPEISEILQQPENTVKSRMYYGLKSMRSTLINWNIQTDYLNHE